MCHPKSFTKEDILRAMENTRSNHAAARYLNCSYTHYKKWAKIYFDENGVSLLKKHANPSGKGIPKFRPDGGANKFPIIDIIEGRIKVGDSYSPNTIKDAMIREGLLREQCANCGFHERRVIDFRMPLLMHFADGNKKNYQLGNLKLYCYNCYYLTIGDIFDRKQLTNINDHMSANNGDFDWELDEYHKKRLDELKNITDVKDVKKDDDDAYSLVSRI